MGAGGLTEVTGEMDIDSWTSYAGTMPMALISCRSRRIADR
jgi:hypothetical protein